MKKTVPVLVIGGGPAGLTLADMLGEDQCHVLERAHTVGGLCKTLCWGGALFDIGGHILTTKYPDVVSYLEKFVSLYRQPRKATVYHCGKLIRYPFQEYYSETNDAKLIRECDEARGAGSIGKPADFEEYLINRMGRGIYEHFCAPYNKKLWGAPLARLTSKWGDERVAARKGDVPERADSADLERLPLNGQSIAAYPSEGGFGEIFSRMHANLNNVSTGKTVRSIDLKRHRVTTLCGDVYSYDRLVSTISIKQFAGIAADIPSNMRNAIQALEALALRLVLVRTKAPLRRSVHRIYSASPKIPAHKIALQNTSSPYLQSLVKHSILGEVSSARTRHLSSRELIQRHVASLVEMGVLHNEAEVDAARVLDVREGYPVPTHVRSRIVREARAYLQNYDVELLGRFAEWDYINSDQVIYRAQDLAKRFSTDELRPRRRAA